MLFNSLSFVILVLVTFVVYYAIPRQRLQVATLIVASLVFYAAGRPILLLLLMACVLLNAWISYAIWRAPTTGLKRFVALGVAANLVLLALFKYGPLIGRTFFAEASPIRSFLGDVPLPIGISFYTFQGISLLIDTLRSRQRLTDVDGQADLMIPASFGRHLVNIALYIAFFPQLVAGPIVRGGDFLPQIAAKRLSQIDWQTSFQALVLGYFLKTVVADNLQEQTFWIAYPYFLGMSTLTLVVLLFGYSAQIFADFAGYSLIAIGVAGLFGYRLMENFNFPYIAASFSEFWQRWHISLSTFLREYLYIPLGGNRKGQSRTYVNLIIVMLLGGLWHGAAWSYAVWGAYHGLLLVVERLFNAGSHRRIERTLPARIEWGRAGKVVLVFVAVSFGWLLFKLPEFDQVLLYLREMGRNYTVIPKYRIVNHVLVYSMPVLLYHLYYLLRDSLLPQYHRLIVPVANGIMIFLIATNRGPVTSFIYFQF